MNNSDYLIHYGILGMRWGRRKQRPRSISKSRTKSKGSSAEDKDIAKARKKVSKASKSAARTYYKKDRTRDFQDYRKYEQQLDIKEARLKPEQIVEGRYRVANARNIKRKVLSAAVGSASTIGLASLGAGAVAPLLGASLSAIANAASGGMYYAGQASAYGKQRKKLQKPLSGVE